MFSEVSGAFVFALAGTWLVAQSSWAMNGIGNASVGRIKRAFLDGMITKFSPTLDPTSEHWIGLAIQHQPPFSRVHDFHRTSKTWPTMATC